LFPGEGKGALTMIKIINLAAAVLVSAALAACGGSSPAHDAASASPAPPSSAVPAQTPSLTGLTCDQVSGEVTTALHDLRVSNRRFQEAWVSGGYGRALRALISVTSAAVSGGDQLNDDAATLSQDASGYLSDNSPYLAPGWQSGYRTVNQDIKALAADCG
jgi:hypothetical protein